MDLIAISYYNIGPFKDKILNIFFDKGKFLIRAPIGSGKSFLFFDGPTYALYKNTGRNVLNVDSKNGYIKLLFEVEGNKYLVVRNLSPGKAKDVCKSQLFIVEGDIGSIVGELSTNNDNKQDIQALLLKKGIKLDEITFKNERDLDGNLSEFLPPREVFLSTVFLLQDSENVFELQPVDRLIVMKNIFNLIGIDNIKDQISDKRREIQTTLKVKSDTSDWDLKIKNLVSNYVSNFKNIVSMDCFDLSAALPSKPRNYETNVNDSSVIANLGSTLLKYKEFMQELEIISDKVNINEFGIDNFDKNLHTQISEYIANHKKLYQEAFVKLEQTQNQIKEKNEKIINVEIENRDIKVSIDQLDLKINQIDPQKIENKKKEKIELINKSESFSTDVNFDVNIPEKLNSFILTKPSNLDDFNTIIIEVIAKGQNFADQMQLIESKIENEKLRIKANIDQIETEIKNMNNNLINLNEQLENIKDKINKLDNTINSESKFECVKINSNCPFIQDINKKTFQELRKQKDSFDEEKKNIENRVKDTQNELKNKQKLDSSLRSEGHTNEEIKKMILEKNNLNETLQVLRQFLTDIDFKNIQDKYQDNKSLLSQISVLDKEILQLEDGAKELENYKNEKIRLSQQIEINEKLKLAINEELSKIDELSKVQKITVDNFDINNLNIIEKINQDMINILRDMENIIAEFKNSQLALNKLKQDEKIVKDLYQIFSKELLLFVLEGYLPVLTDIINSFLSQVVEYNIDIKLIQKNDNLEMDVSVYDEKGIRDIKSLSGGQKVILKLVWMLAISSYMKSPILFLDETINNLDNDTVGKVADMLSDFVKQRDLKFYTVTHSQQIQEMDIWDKIIHIEDII